MFIADYMEHFQCIGERCEDSCCSGWGVIIDKNTYKKYQKANPPTLRSLLKDSLKRTKKPLASNKNYAQIRLTSEKKCPLLDRKGLCQVHSQMGEKALSKTCKTYPRIEHWVDGMTELSGTLSCPEVARLALQKPEGIGFKEIEIDNTGHSIQHQFLTEKAEPSSADRLFWQLQLSSIEVLKNRELPLWKRMLQLGMTCQQLENDKDNLSNPRVAEIFNAYQNLFVSAESQKKIDQIDSSPEVVISVIGKFLDIARSSKGQTLGFEKHFQLASEYLNSDSQNNSLESRYMDALETYYKPTMKERDYILENYLVNSAFQSLFPVRPTRNVFENYMTLAINFSAIQFYLVGLSGALKEEFNGETVVSFIQSFVKAIEHDAQLLENIRSYFKTKGFDSMTMMALLVKEPSPITDKKATKPAAKPVFALS